MSSISNMGNQKQDRIDMTKAEKAGRKYEITEDARVLVNVMQISTGMVSLRECGGLLRNKKTLKGVDST